MKVNQAKISQNLLELVNVFDRGQPWGGGSASAVGSLVAIGLLFKVIGYSKFNKSRTEQLIRTLEQAKKDLLRLAWEDGEVFDRFAKNRDDLTCRLAICEVPFGVAELQLTLMEMAVFLAKKGNSQLVSDAMVAQELIQASFFGGLEMVKGNLVYLPPDEKDLFLKKIEQVLEEFKLKNQGIGG